MFEEMTIGELLSNLRSIKVTPKSREYIDRARVYLESNGALPVVTQMKLRAIAKRYWKQMNELLASRERARRSNGLRAMGMSKVCAEKRVKEREAEAEKRRLDVGF